MMADQQLSRRDCLLRGAGAVLAAGTAAVGGYWLHDPTGDAGLVDPAAGRKVLPNYFTSVDLPASSPRISVAIGERDQVESLVREAVGGLDPSLGIKRFVVAGDVVLIKPNVGFDRPPRLGATTNPEVVRALVRLCKEAGAAEVLVTDNPIETPQTCFSRSKVGPVVEEEGGTVVLPAAHRLEMLTIRDKTPDPQKGEALQRWPILYGPLARADKVIGVAPIKDHNLSQASMNLKNWYGLLGGRRNKFHQAIHHIVSDLGLMVSPTLVVGDGTRVMMTNGPTGGKSTDVKVGGMIGRPTVVASVDQVACDAWCYEHLLGRDPAGLKYLEMAEAKIQAQIEAGVKRLGRRDWRVYAQQGLIKTVTG